MANHDRILALAGMYQAAELVRQISRTGEHDRDSFVTSIESILKTDVDTTEEIYGSVRGLWTGMHILSTLFDRETKARDLEITRYVLGIVHLEKKLTSNSALMDKLIAGIDRAKHQSETFGSTHENVIASLADTYSNTVSTIQPRIVVSGDQGHLMATHNANKVRALLLAVMRSAVLWKQKKGARWHLILGRGGIIKEAKAVIKEYSL